MSGCFWPRAIHDHGVDRLSQNYARAPQHLNSLTDHFGLLRSVLFRLSRGVLTDITMKFATVSKSLSASQPSITIIGEEELIYRRLVMSNEGNCRFHLTQIASIDSIRLLNHDR